MRIFTSWGEKFHFPYGTPAHDDGVGHGKVWGNAIRFIGIIVLFIRYSCLIPSHPSSRPAGDVHAGWGDERERASERARDGEGGRERERKTEKR
eukprot:scaffold312277_cov22-Tisochrysis_lutea.AAC.1